MKVSQDIIFYSLSQRFNAKFASKAGGLCVGRPVFQTQEAQPYGHAVILRGGEPPIKQSKAPEGILFIKISGAPISLGDGKNHSVIELSGEISADKVFNALQELFDLLDRWDDMLKETVSESIGYKRLIQCCDMLFSEPLCLYDNELQYVTYSDMSVTNGNTESPDGKDVNVPDYVMRELDIVLSSENNNLKREAFLLSFSFGDSILKNLFYDGESIGRLAMKLTDDNKEKQLYYMAIFNHLSYYVEKLYGKTMSFNNKEASFTNFRSTLSDCASGRSVSDARWMYALSEIGWNADSRYQLVKFGLNPGSEKNINYRYTMTEIEQNWKGCICFEHLETLLLLVNHDELYIKTNSDMTFSQALDSYLSDNLISAGLSREFMDIRNLSLAGVQAYIAFDIGAQADGDFGYYSFDDYALEYILISGLGPFSETPELILSNKLIRLMEHDTTKGTGYVETLRAYYKCRFNATDAAKSLYISRSSFLSRMERMRDIVDINPESSDELLYIALSIRSLDVKKNRQ